MKDRLLNIVSQFDQKKILVLGDVMLDEYIWGEVERISPEAPVPVVLAQRVSAIPGGAANVAMNVSSLGGKAYLIGVIGDDQEGQQLNQLFSDNGIVTEGLIADPGRPTTVKTRIIAHAQQVVRVDREERVPLSDPFTRNILETVDGIIGKMDAILISDYDKGVVTPKIAGEVISKAKIHGKLVSVDPKGVDYSKYRGATVITPNQHEAEVASGKAITSEETLTRAGQVLLNQLNTQYMLITRGDRGMSLFQRDGKVTHIQAIAREVHDVTGAGDTVVATLTLAMAAGAEIEEAARLANYAAGIVVGKVGTAVPTTEELVEAIRHSKD